MIGRRSFITGLVSLVAAPAIVRAGSLMPVKAVDDLVFDYAELYGRSPFSAITLQIEAIRRLEQARAWRSAYLADVASYREFMADTGPAAA